jgi:hypothetical protein
MFCYATLPQALTQVWSSRKWIQNQRELQYHFPTLGFSPEPWKVPTVIKKWGWLRIHEIKVPFHEEGTGLYYHYIHDLAWWWWKVTVMDRNEAEIQSNKSHVVQVSSVWNKLWLEIKWNTSLSGHPTWKINVLTHTLQRSKLPLPFKKFLLSEHHYLLSQLCKQNRLQVQMVIAFSWGKHDW